MENVVDKEVSRRDFFRIGIAAIGTFIATVVGVPIVGYLISPALKKKIGERVQLGSTQDFQINQPKMVEFTVFRKDGWVEERARKAVWVVKAGEQDFTVFNGRCTHLGCAYSWKDEGTHKDHFFCPCHDGVYDATGRVLGGPPPRPLDRLPVSVEDGKVFIEYKEFRVGVPDQLEL